MAKEEIIKYDVTIEWINKVFALNGIDGFKLDEEVYFFFKEVGVEEHPRLTTVWIKHPELMSLTILPYTEEVKKGKK